MVNPTSTPTAQAEPTAAEATSTLSPTATPAPQSSTSEAEGNGSTEAAEASLRIVAEKGLGTGVDASLVGTATLADGRMIVTYNKMPLYYWYEDTKPEDAFGQGVGSVWYVIRWDGTPVIE